MDKICIFLAFNGRWSADFKYIDHDTKLLLVTKEITFEALMNKIYEVINFDREKVWFEINPGTNKGLLVTKDEELTTSLNLLTSDSHIKSRFIVDIPTIDSESNEIQQEEGQLIMATDDQQGMHGQLLEPAHISNEMVGTSTSLKLKRRRSKKKGKELTTAILRDNASSDEITVGSIFEDKKSLIKCFCNIAIKEYFAFRVIKSSTKKYYAKCKGENCGWYVSACGIKDSPLFRVVGYENNHECSVDTKASDLKYAVSKLASDYITDILQDTRFEITPAFVSMEMKRRYGLDIGYHKAWRAIQVFKKQNY